MKNLAILAILTLGLSGCSGLFQNGAPTAASCKALEVAATQPLLVAKCAKAPDPLKDSSCISISALTTAAALCWAQVEPPVLEETVTTTVTTTEVPW